MRRAERKRRSDENQQVLKFDADRNRAHAPGQYLGWSLQETRFVQTLLEARPGTTVTLEVFEDVGSETRTGQRRAVQTKSALTQNPIADHSVDLWKTFANWTKAVLAGELSIQNTIFELYVSAPKNGRIVRRFHDARSPEAARFLTAVRRRS